MSCKTRSIIDCLKVRVRKTANVCYGRQYVNLTFSALSEYVYTYFNKILLCWLTRLSRLLNIKIRYILELYILIKYLEILTYFYLLLINI
jgi:hypothetical protein